MKTNKFRLLSLAALAVSTVAIGSPAVAHEGYFRGHEHFGYPGHRVVVVRPVVVYRPGPVYYAPAPVYYDAPAPVYYAPAPVYYPPAPVYYESSAAATLGGAIAGAAIGGIASHGRPGAIVAGSVIGAVVGNGLAR
jgi:hypothetical protein